MPYALPVDPFRLDLYTRRVAAAYHVDPAAILGPTRKVNLVECRRIVWLALSADGYAVMAIANAFRRNHSTIAYGIDCAAKRPELVAAAGRIRQLAVPDTLPARALGASEGECRSILAYLWFLVGRRPFDTAVLAGLRVLALRPLLREQLSVIARRYRCAAELWRVEVHARQIGAPYQRFAGGAAAAVL